MQKYFCLTLMAALCATMMTGCTGNDEPADEPNNEITQSDCFSISKTDPTRMTLTLDASDFGAWNYVSLKNLTVEKLPIPLTCEGEWDGKSGLTYLKVGKGRPEVISTTQTDPQPEAADWDFAIHYFDVKTNGAEVAMTEIKDIAGVTSMPADLTFSPDVWSNSQVIVDRKNMMDFQIGYQNSFVNKVLSGWVTMDITTPPPTYTTTGAVYILRLADGTDAALQLRSYVNEMGEKGHLTVDIIYPLK